VLDFLSSTDVGRLVPPLEEEGHAGSEVSEWELRERRERQEEREAEAEARGVVDDMGDGEELPLFLPTPSFVASAGEEEGTGHAFLFSLLLLISLGASTLSLDSPPPTGNPPTI